MNKDLLMTALGFTWLDVKMWVLPEELEKEFLQLQHWHVAVESPMNHKRVWDFIRTHCPYPISKTEKAHYRIDTRSENWITICVGDRTRYRDNPAGKYWLWNAWGLLDTKSH